MQRIPRQAELHQPQVHVLHGGGRGPHVQVGHDDDNNNDDMMIMMIMLYSEADTLVTSPTSHRKSLHNIKKSFSLKQKKSFHGGGGGLYVDIDSQGNI